MEQKLTFKDVLEKCKDDEMIYVGFNEGSSWYVIETKKVLMEHMDELESELHRKSKHELKRLNKLVRKYGEEIAETSVNLMESWKNSGESAWLHYERELNNLISKYLNSFEQREIVRTRLEHWVELPDRDVKKAYRHTSEVQGLCVVLDGYEKGSLWFYGEHKVI